MLCDMSEREQDPGINRAVFDHINKQIVCLMNNEYTEIQAVVMQTIFLARTFIGYLKLAHESKTLTFTRFILDRNNINLYIYFIYKNGKENQIAKRQIDKYTD